MFRNVLAPCDLEGSSEAGLDYAADLARSQGARLVVVHVLTSRAIDVTDVPHQAAPLRRRAEDQAAATLEPMVAEVAEGVETEIVVRFGDPAREILRVAGEFEADAIVITVKNRSRVGKLLMGSHAQEIILASTRPVICVPKG